jgi:hypothetical protein
MWRDAGRQPDAAFWLHPTRHRVRTARACVLQRLVHLALVQRPAAVSVKVLKRSLHVHEELVLQSKRLRSGFRRSESMRTHAMELRG